MDSNIKLIEVWSSAREIGEKIPKRKSINPSLLKEYLPSIVILERRGDEHMFIRISGTSIDDLFNMKLQSMNSLEFSSKSSRGIFDKLYSNLFDHKCGAIGHRIIVTHMGSKFDCEVTILPLEGQTPDRPQYILWFNIHKLKISNAFVNKLEVRNYYKIEFLDLGNGVPDIDIKIFSFDTEAE